MPRKTVTPKVPPRDHYFTLLRSSGSDEALVARSVIARPGGTLQLWIMIDGRKYQRYIAGGSWTDLIEDINGDEEPAPDAE